MKVIVIPIYKVEMSEFELISLNQNLKVLQKHPIVFVAPNLLDCKQYESLAKELNVRYCLERFDNKYFQNIQGYNRLLLSQTFYRRFEKYDYILICQLDTYIFNDDLDYWCSLNYDYIGAPLIGNFNEKKFMNSLHMRVGNGGLSLRKIGSFKYFFDCKKNVFSIKQIIKLINLWEKPHTRIFVCILMALGWRNKPISVTRYWKYNEDDFWSGLLDNSKYALNKPDPRMALEFAFERFPSSCFEITKKLPFGCHAWEKYEYETFWEKYIK